MLTWCANSLCIPLAFEIVHLNELDGLHILNYTRGIIVQLAVEFVPF